MGTIGGFRFGFLYESNAENEQEVKWNEINTAIGQAVHLLVYIGHKLEFE